MVTPRAHVPFVHFVLLLVVLLLVQRRISIFALSEVDDFFVLLRQSRRAT